MRVAVVGDVHGQFDDVDVAALDARGLDLVCFVGDLPSWHHRDTLDVARRLSRLRTPAVVMPGNHDATTPFGVLAEATGVARRRGGAERARRRFEALRRALGPIPLAGYSLHPVPGHAATVVAARPHAMDPRWVCFPDAIAARYGVSSLAESAARLRALVDRAPGDLLFLGHSGPAGLGNGPRDPFASRRGRDLGDTDLADAVAYARGRGRRVLAVLAGHVHHRGDRDWLRVHDGVTTVNAARVPRWVPSPSGLLRHHVEITVSGGEVHADAIVLESAGVAR